jgi:hypothetical protein
LLFFEDLYTLHGEAECIRTTTILPYIRTWSKSAKGDGNRPKDTLSTQRRLALLVRCK